MATDATGGTLLVRAELDVEGFPITAGSARFIPFINGDYDLWAFPTAAEADANDTTDAIQFADNLNADPQSSNTVVAGSYTAANKAAAVLLTPISGKTLFVESSDGSLFKAVTGAAPGTYSDADTAYCGDVFIPTGGDGSAAWVSTSLFITVEMFGAVGDKTTDDTTAIQAALNSFDSPLGGVVLLDTAKRYKVTNLTIPDNVVIDGQMLILDQDEGNSFTYDTFWGGILLISGTITSGGHGSGIVRTGLLASHLNGYSTPTTDGEANALVALFAGTAITASGTGCTYKDLMILGFTNAFVDAGNRHRLENIRFDCTNGITVGGGSDVTKVFDCHGWPYLTAELGLSLSTNYRSGTAFKVQNNSDKFSLRDVYSFGYEKGCYFIGAAANVVQSCTAYNIIADSGEIGGSGTSVGIDIGDYVADLTIHSPSTQNCDINMRVDTGGTDGAGRFDKVVFFGGTSLEPSSKSLHIIDGHVVVNGMIFQKGSTSTVCIDWDSPDGGVVTNCMFEEMFSASGAGDLINFASTAVDIAVSRNNNDQDPAIHIDNHFVDNVSASLKTLGLFNIDKAGELTIAAGVVTITGSYHQIDTEADAATDILDTINGGSDGDILILRAADQTRTVVVKDGTGNINCAGDFSLDNSADRMLLQYDTSLAGGKWVEISRSDNEV
jgi:hypothetical protein